MFFDGSSGRSNSLPNSYWEARKDILYYQVARVITSHLSKKAKTIIDVGSAGCPYLDWFSHVPMRTSLDLKRPYEAKGVKSITSNFLTWEPDRKYDIVTCFQVLEHVPDAEGFAQKLLEVGGIVIVSVPYKWPKGRTKSHVQDPVDEEKMLSWFHREPNFQYVCREVVAPVNRLIQVYDLMDGPWDALGRRDRLWLEKQTKDSSA
ncbi:methyltransferase domain-containing protein [Microvirga aerilata]|uniref:Methyltransferase domain-containing protein n=2 Tax=Microvirga aerilata TaxID=670292 RepID=A0A937D4G1_9HYPH|nr:methyltransferase domain-containing protein [Microvirga aerilata]